MHQVAASDNEHAFVTQAVQPLRGFVVKLCRLRLINAELDNGHVCFREDVAEHRPSAVVQSPSLIQINQNGSEHFLDALRKLRIAVSWVRDVVQFTWEAAEVMNRP